MWRSKRKRELLRQAADGGQPRKGGEEREAGLIEANFFAVADAKGACLNDVRSRRAVPKKKMK